MRKQIYTITSAFILVAFFCGLLAIASAETLSRLEALGFIAIDFLFGGIGVTVGNLGTDEERPTNA